MYPLMRFLLMMKPRRRRRRGTRNQNGCSTEGKEHVMLLVKWCVIPPPIHIKRRAVAMIEAGHTLEDVRQHVWDVTGEKVYLQNQRQLNGWAKMVQKVEGLVLPRGTKRISGGGRKAQFREVDHDLWKWFCDWPAQNLPVSSQLLKKAAGDFASENGHRVSEKWVERFHRRHRIVLRKSQRRWT